MRSVMIKCPVTGRDVRTGVSVTKDEYFRTMDVEDVQLSGCPACGGTHVWSKSDSFLGE